MLILMHNPKTANAHWEDLKNHFSGNQSSLDWLVVAHNDPLMTRRLQEVVNDKTAVMLKVPQGQWEMQEQGLLAAVKGSINEAGVKHLLIVGHSQADVAVSDATWLGNGLEKVASRDARQSSYDRLLAGARQSQDHLQRAKDHYASQVAYLLQDESLREKVVNGRVQLHLLFYIAQSGAFLSYNLATNEFQPLAE